MEVENALNVLDGCVIVLDSSAGSYLNSEMMFLSLPLNF